MISPTIRFAKRTELTAIVKLCALHADYEACKYDPTDKKEKLETHFFSKNPSAYCLVVDYDNQIIGYATYMKQFSTWDADFYVYLDCLFIKEAFRSKGIGEQVIAQIKRHATKLSCNLIQWQTPDFNTRAIKFYKKIGGVSKPKERFFLTV